MLIVRSRFLGLIFLGVLLSESAFSGSILFFHWGTAFEPNKRIDNAALLAATNYPFNGAHFDKLSLGSGELWESSFSHVRHQAPMAKGKGFYVSRSFSSSNYGPDLIIFELVCNDDCSQFVKSLGSHDPMIGGPFEIPGEADDYHVIYRSPNDWERSQGARILVRPPGYGDDVRIWDQMAGHSDYGKTKFAEYLTDVVMQGSKSDSVNILFKQMLFDRAYGAIEHHMAQLAQNPGANPSRWHRELFRPLTYYLKIAPDSDKTRNLLARWSQLPKTLSDGHLQMLGNSAGAGDARTLVGLLPARLQQETAEDLLVQLTTAFKDPQRNKLAVNAFANLAGLYQGSQYAALRTKYLQPILWNLLFESGVDLKFNNSGLYYQLIPLLDPQKKALLVERELAGGLDIDWYIREKINPSGKPVLVSDRRVFSELLSSLVGRAKTPRAKGMVLGKFINIAILHQGQDRLDILKAVSEQARPLLKQGVNISMEAYRLEIDSLKEVVLRVPEAIPGMLEEYRLNETHFRNNERMQEQVRYFDELKSKRCPDGIRKLLQN